MIRIDDLTIELPGKLGAKAARIARLVQEKSRHLRINHREPDDRGKLDTMTLPDIQIKVPADENAIAEQIVACLEQSLKKGG